ncbi:hypothetical protein F5X99DRAFT_404595 [Biscogniauxia marginata]|nr:hypothetical protein F5X99DRAFT_404595 [Biscogniauxia marginata]
MAPLDLYRNSILERADVYGAAYGVSINDLQRPFWWPGNQLKSCSQQFESLGAQMTIINAKSVAYAYLLAYCFAIETILGKQVPRQSFEALRQIHPVLLVAPDRDDSQPLETLDSLTKSLLQELRTLVPSDTLNLPGYTPQHWNLRVNINERLQVLESLESLSSPYLGTQKRLCLVVNIDRAENEATIGDVKRFIKVLKRLLVDKNMADVLLLSSSRYVVPV